ncbi:hypothetical protein O181_000326 [Austropuccinia psidii MF-1]|uniref:Uncharacterized protein n=1 Tax=Austropuccinia psidii MF-1 TaxID=1389203 RepID=A0A9Q3B8U4_9BASI|nr:hypothetical protein [Austropuccinia psidii MF-1]
MSSTRSGSNYSIKSNGSGPGHSSHKSKRQECQTRGEAQMEYSRNSTSFQRYEQLPAGRNGNISVSVQELVYGSKAEGVGTYAKPLDRDNELLYLRQVQQIKFLFKKQGILSEDQKKELAKKKDNSPVEATKASTRKNMPQKLPKKVKKGPKSQHKGKKKTKWNKPYPLNYTIPKREKTAMNNVFNMARTLMEFKKQEEERMNQSFQKK